MVPMKKIILFVFLHLAFFSSRAQNSVEKDSTINDSVKNIKFSYKQLIIPTVLIGYGFWGMESGQIKSFNFQIRD